MISFFTLIAYLYYAFISEWNETLNSIIFNNKLEKLGFSKTFDRWCVYNKSNDFKQHFLFYFLNK